MTRLEERIRSGLKEAAERIPDTATTPAAERLRSPRPAGVWAAVAAVAAALVLSIPILLLDAPDPGTTPVEPSSPSTVTTPPSAGDPSPFLGRWVSRAGGTIPTMVIQVSEDGSVEMVMHERDAYYETVPGRFYQVCLGAPSTMTATGDIDSDNHLVFPSPVLTCDDGSAPADGAEEPGGAYLEKHLQNLTFTHDPLTDTLTDSFESTWTREGADSPTTTLPLDAQPSEILDGFVEARIAGEGAQQYLIDIAERGIPLIYATSTGAPYDRGEFEQVNGYEWPYGFVAFKVRMFAADTVVEQLLFMSAGKLTYQPDGFGTEIAPTTENGQPVASLSYDLFDGEVTLHFPHPWVSTGGDFLRLIPEGVGPTTDGGQRNTWDTLSIAADTAPGPTGCQTEPGPADVEALAEVITSHPDIEATAPVAVSVGGAEALMMDLESAVALGDLQRVCDTGVLRLGFDSPGTATPDKRERLYLLDAPEGSSVQMLAISLIAPESGFQKAVDAIAPVVDSIEFHTP